MYRVRREAALQLFIFARRNPDHLFQNLTLHRNKLMHRIASPPCRHTNRQLLNDYRIRALPIYGKAV